MKSALIIEDQVLFSDLLMRVLKRELGVEHVDVCRNGREGLDLALRLRPHIVLVDLYLPGLSGMEVLRDLRAQIPECVIVMMTAFETPELIEDFRRGGADGFVAKHASFLHLLSVIEQLKVNRQIRKAGDGTAEPLFIGISSTREREASSASQSSLTLRELELLTYVAQGFSTKAIAPKMKISFKTAQTHRANLMRKLGIHEVATLTRYAIHHGLVRPNPVNTFTEAPAEQNEVPEEQNEVAEERNEVAEERN